jgi:hypothetical protein
MRIRPEYSAENAEQSLGERSTEPAENAEGLESTEEADVEEPSS